MRKGEGVGEEWTGASVLAGCVRTRSGVCVCSLVCSSTPRAIPNSPPAPPNDPALVPPSGARNRPPAKPTRTPFANPPPPTHTPRHPIPNREYETRESARRKGPAPNPPQKSERRHTNQRFKGGFVCVLFTTTHGLSLSLTLLRKALFVPELNCWP